jgi:hypothetical protein
MLISELAAVRTFEEAGSAANPPPCSPMTSLTNAVRLKR